ncbi:MAG: hypothetical protein AAGH89_16180 [Verrucomicrobiota bacterium]
MKAHSFPPAKAQVRGDSTGKLIVTIVVCFFGYHLFGQDLMNGFTGLVDRNKYLFKAQEVQELCASANRAGCNFVEADGDVEKTLKNISQGLDVGGRGKTAGHFRLVMTDAEIRNTAPLLEIVDGQLLVKRDS